MNGSQHNKHKKIAQNAHSVESAVHTAMSVESLNKRDYTMKKTVITSEHARDLTKKFNIPMEKILEEYEIKVPHVPGGKGMSVLKAIKERGELVEIYRNLQDSLSELSVGQKLQVLKNLVAELNESDDFTEEVQKLYPALKEGLKVEFNWKDRSKINQTK